MGVECQKLAEENISAEKFLYPIDKVFSEYRAVRLNPHQEKLYRNGIRLDLERVKNAQSGINGEKFRVFGADGTFIGTAYADTEAKELRIDKNF